MMTFSESDIKAIELRGSKLETVVKQIAFFKSGFPSLFLVKAASIGDGILAVSPSVLDSYLKIFESKVGDFTTLKFVPASGAASRMFKELFGFMESYTGTDSEYEKFVNTGEAHPVFKFFKNIEKFAFYSDLSKAYENSAGQSLAEGIIKRDYVTILKIFLTDAGLNYGNLPKGLLKFHKYPNGECRTPVEEHLVEGAMYAKDASGKVRVHFTVSPEHLSNFKDHINAIKSRYEKKYGVTYNITFSEQKKSTDTIAVDLNDIPFRDDEGLLFRPAGHGALIENLNDLKADITFIKNIDNVVPDGLRQTTYDYKKVLAAVLIEQQSRIYKYIQQLDQDPDSKLVDEISGFISKELCTKLNFLPGMSLAEKIRLIKSKLNRPLRVCGMVKNEGEPGGGPFWALNNDGSISLQIVETAQIDLTKSDQKAIFEASSHFNPVDLVCSLMDYKRRKFDLTKYTDPQTGFITKKSKDGRELKAQELPGLWNGAMSDWNTIFVEVPIITFNPVKTVNDLLKKEHQ